MHSVCRLKYFIFSIIAPIPKPFPLVFWAANSVFNQKKTENRKGQISAQFQWISLSCNRRTLILQPFLVSFIVHFCYKSLLLWTETQKWEVCLHFSFHCHCFFPFLQNSTAFATDNPSHQFFRLVYQYR